ncbi:hypothetical protein ACFUMI_27120, partial [Streptomyces sp. NPDC057273]|uniref:hypothetical protein n=1 Tax=Streptomyces sp. NPDC057273 TaxID=3346080 RepID=UPI0036338C42
AGGRPFGVGLPRTDVDPGARAGRGLPSVRARVADFLRGACGSRTSCRPVPRWAPTRHTIQTVRRVGYSYTL